MKTKYSQILILFHVLFIILLNSNNTSGQIWPTKPGSQKYCGPRLADMLDSLCIEFTYTPSTETKRSNSIGDDYFLTKHGSPFLDHRYALTSFFRQRRQEVVTAHDECCEKGCSIQELLGYCSKPRIPQNPQNPALV